MKEPLSEQLPTIEESLPELLNELEEKIISEVAKVECDQNSIKEINKISVYLNLLMGLIEDYNTEERTFRIP